ncbi:MAG: 3-dehydroquinate synthase [Parachlamydiales bacterium]|nr:3-dehydroquinate synthase [Parachlamydiales bacterium]
MKKILIRSSIDIEPTVIYIGDGLLASARMIEHFRPLNGKKVIVADRAVKDLYAVDLARLIGAEILTIPGKEKTKVWETAASLLDELFKMGAGRDTTLIAIGGGVTMDLVGFVASIYMRGVPLVLIPTTLLAAVDASIGGKTAIDTPFGKNLLGTIYHPKAIFTDFNTLRSLPEKEWFNGLAEILKMGLIYDDSLWENGKGHDQMIQAIEGKIAVIEQDPREQSLRRILNFGHTIGHALEALSHYEMSHGEAVALGCLAESHLSMRLGYLQDKDFEQIQERYRHFSLKWPKTYTRTKLMQAMAHDKKKTLGETRFVLIDKIGHAIPFEGAYCRPVAPSELASTLDWMERVCQ